MLRHVQVPGMRSCPSAPQPFPCPPCWSTFSARWRQEKEIPGVLFPLLCNTHASARRRIHESPSMAAASVSHVPREGPRAGGAPTASGRNDAVSGTIYQPSRRHIDFFVLPRCCCSCRQHGQPEMPPSQRCWHSSCLMVSMLTESWRAATTREGTALRQPGRLTGSGSEWRFVRRWPSAQRGQSPGDAVGTGTGREDARRAMTRLWLPPSG